MAVSGNLFNQLTGPLAPKLRRRYMPGFSVLFSIQKQGRFNRPQRVKSVSQVGGKSFKRQQFS